MQETLNNDDPKYTGTKNIRRHNAREMGDAQCNRWTVLE